MRRTAAAVALIAVWLTVGPADARATHAVRLPCRFHVTCADGNPTALIHARCRNGWDHPRTASWCDETQGDGVCVFAVPTPCGNMAGCAEQIAVPVNKRRVRRVSGGRLVLRCRPRGPEGAPCATDDDCPVLLGSPCRQCVEGTCFYDPRCY